MGLDKALGQGMASRQSPNPETSKSEDAGGRESTGERYQRIYKAIRERISLLNYPPGTVLSEAELAGEFGISRTPVRRVLQRLNHEGLVEIKNGVGTIVTDIDLKTFKDIYDLRMRLAELLGELSPKPVTDAQLEAMGRLVKRTETLRAGPDIEGYARIANDLEEVLIDMIGSAPLREVTDVLYYRVSRIWFTFLPNLDWNDVVDAQEAELTQMVEAMQRGDLRAVGQIRRIYLHGILTRLSDYITGR
jgi:DNA-binding GntR family transcriptional regulator